jgi:hypothetical protein
VIKKYIATVTLTLVCATALAQSPPATPAPAPPGAGLQQTAPRPSRPSASTAQQPSTTITGCLYREEQIPGRKPNVAERAGVLEDYILVDTTMPNQPASAGKPATPGTTGTTGTREPATPSYGRMFKVENIPGEKLKTLLGKRVEVTGRIDPEGSAPNRPGDGGAPTADKGLGPDAINLPEFEANAIREVPGGCLAFPSTTTTPRQ